MDGPRVYYKALRGPDPKGKQGKFTLLLANPHSESLDESL